MGKYATGQSLYRWLKKGNTMLKLNESQAELIVSVLASDNIQLICKSDRIQAVTIDAVGKPCRDTNLEDVILLACEADSKINGPHREKLMESMRGTGSFHELSVQLQEYIRLTIGSRQLQQAFEQTKRYKTLIKRLEQDVKKEPVGRNCQKRRMGR